MIPIGPIIQIAQTLIMAETNRFNSVIREDIARNTLLTTQLNHEQQLKMFHLTEHYKQQEKWVDSENREEFIHEQGALQAHNNKMASCDEYYKMGHFIEERLRNKPAPLILISTNPFQKYNPFKNEALTIAPLNRITDTIRQINGIYEDKRLLTISDTNEFFMSEGDVSSFYHRELNCPCIIIYANFTGESLVISAYIAGILDSQRKNISLENKNIDLSPKRELLWNIPYHNIHEIVSKYTELKRPPYEGLSHLSELTNNLVVLHIQRYLDEYFKYLSSSVYESQTLNFVNSKRENLHKQFPKLLESLEEYHSSILSLSKKITIKNNVEFKPLKDILDFDSLDTEKVIFKELPFLLEYNKYSKWIDGGFSCGLLAIKIENGNLLDTNNGKWGFIDTNSKLRIPPIYDDAHSMIFDMAAVNLGEKWGIIDKKGNILLAFDYDFLYIDKLGIISYEIDEKYGIMDLDLEIIVSHRYSNFESLINVFEYIEIADKLLLVRALNGFNDFTTEMLNNHLGRTGSKDAFKDSDTSKLKQIEKAFEKKERFGFKEIYDEKLKQQKTDLSLTNSKKMSKIEQFEKYGFIDETGNIVYDYIFKVANDFCFDRAFVQFEGFEKTEWAIIDNKGNILTKATE